MISDLIGQGSVSRDADIAIVGGGTAGLLTAVMLARTGKFSVLCLESGGMHQVEDEHPLNEVEHAVSVYQGAAHGRFRCIGGTSTRWGGALIPFQKSDLTGWPIAMEELAPFVEQVEGLFGVEPGAYTPDDFPARISASHTPRLAKWPPFKKRNVYNLLANDCASDRGSEIVLNATVTAMDVQDGALRSLIARAPDGSEMRVKARSFIVAAGAIETTRLALVLDQQNAGVISSASPGLLGRYFSDHLSVEVAEVRPVSSSAFNRLVGFRFSNGGTMRNLRFELSDDSPARATVPPCFAHVGFRTDTPGGFDALRDFFRFVQKRKLPPAGVFLQLAGSAPWLVRALWWRFAERRLLFPAKATLMAHMVVEQAPHADNRITLSTTSVDAYGVPLARIEWRTTGKDVANLTRAVDALEAMWHESELSRLAQWVRRPAGDIEKDLLVGGGIYHPTGSTMMGESASTGVVDRHLRVHAVPNLRLLSTSVLPSGGGANPTMMLLLLAMRCVAEFERAAGTSQA